MLSRIRHFISYLFGKRSELQQLDVRDAVMAGVILDIHVRRSGKEVVAVPLHSLKMIHVLDRETAMQAVEKRVVALQGERDRLLDARCLTLDLLNEAIPSVSAMKVVRDRDGSYLAYEGNGRIAALLELFGENDGISVEVEEYRFRNPKRTLKGLHKVRSLDGLE